jgi:hypothetical protein
MSTTTLIPRATIEDVVGFRDKALELYGEAWTAIERADAALRAAHDMAARAHPGVNNYNYDRCQELEEFYKAISLPERESFLRTAKKLTDINAWAWLVQRTDLERLMDHQAKEQLRDQMRYVPDKVEWRGQLITGDEAAKGMPELSVENVYATLEKFQAEAGTIFRRGIANAFSALDRRFKSHDGFKIGSRVILTRAFSEWGQLQWGRARDELIDVERVFAVLDGHPEGQFQSAVAELSNRGRYSSAHQSEHETAYFKINCYMNGNAHLWFTRKDLVEKVNKLLAEYYGEVIGDGNTEEPDIFSERKTTPARRFGFFPTPDGAAESLIEKVPLHIDRGKPALRILEPSAGTGNLARRLAKTFESDGWRDEPAYSFRHKVDCVELQPELAGGLQSDGLYNRVICRDFLSIKPSELGAYDLVVMNPPFDLERDIDHVTHAFEFLKPGGQLWAIMSAGTEFRETKKAKAFRAMADKLRTRRWSHRMFEELPPGSFAEVGTYVNTIIVGLEKK